ncbi:MAG: peptidase M20, partial [Saccharomonospora viridis]
MVRVELAKVKNSVRRLWADDVVPSLSKLISIPALSPVFDADWAENGHLDAAVEHVKAWLDARGIEGARTDVVRLPGRSPVLLFDVPATEGAEDKGTVLMYGHLDKQPPVGGWSEGLGPWTPVL